MANIQMSDELIQELKDRKVHDKESYEEIIWDLLEDSMELSEETKRNIKQAEEEYKRGEFYTLNQIKKKLNL